MNRLEYPILPPPHYQNVLPLVISSRDLEKETLFEGSRESNKYRIKDVLCSRALEKETSRGGSMMYFV